MADDLFQVPPPRTRRTDPQTSHQAAAAVAPQVGTIRADVLAFAKVTGALGFIDEALSARFGSEAFSSYRTRRAELVEECLILDSGKRRRNERGRDCIVWVHRDHFPGQAPPIRERRQDARQLDQDKLAGRDMAAALAGYAESLKREGRAMLSNQLQEASELMARLAR